MTTITTGTAIRITKEAMRSMGSRETSAWARTGRVTEPGEGVGMWRVRLADGSEATIGENDAKTISETEARRMGV